MPGVIGRRFLVKHIHRDIHIDIDVNIHMCEKVEMSVEKKVFYMLSM